MNNLKNSLSIVGSLIVLTSPSIASNITWLNNYEDKGNNSFCYSNSYRLEVHLLNEEQREEIKTVDIKIWDFDREKKACNTFHDPAVNLNTVTYSHTIKGITGFKDKTFDVTFKSHENTLVFPVWEDSTRSLDLVTNMVVHIPNLFQFKNIRIFAKDFKNQENIKVGQEGHKFLRTESIEQRLELGERYIEEGIHDEAKIILTSIQEDDPQHVKANSLLQNIPTHPAGEDEPLDLLRKIKGSKNPYRTKFIEDLYKSLNVTSMVFVDQKQILELEVDTSLKQGDLFNPYRGIQAALNDSYQTSTPVGITSGQYAVSKLTFPKAQKGQKISLRALFGKITIEHK